MDKQIKENNNLSDKVEKRLKELKANRSDKHMSELTKIFYQPGWLKIGFQFYKMAIMNITPETKELSQDIYELFLLTNGEWDPIRVLYLSGSNKSSD